MEVEFIINIYKYSTKIEIIIKLLLLGDRNKYYVHFIKQNSKQCLKYKVKVCVKKPTFVKT